MLESARFTSAKVEASSGSYKSNRNWQDYESSARSYPQNIPLTLIGAEGSYLIADDGKRYLDLLTGAGVHLLGHSHPAIRKAIATAMAPISSLDIATTAKGRFIEAFLLTLPEKVQDSYKVHFCGPTGSDAIEAALKLARIATGRDGVFAFSGSYHGMTQGALGVTSCVRLRRSGLRSLSQVTFCPFPYPLRGIGPMGDSELAVDYSLAHIEALLSDDHSGCDRPGIMLMELVQGEGGNVVAPKRFVEGLSRLCQKYSILLAFDEIQSGMGRTGAWYSFEHYHVMPDIFTVSKGVGGGFPLALLVYKRELDVWKSGDHIGTFRGQSYAFAAGKATIDTILDEQLLGHAERTGALLRAGLEKLAINHPSIREIRGLGLFLGVECADELRAGEVVSRAKQLQQEMLSHGVVIERGGRNGSVLRFLPPISVSKTEIEIALDALERSLNTIEA